MEQESSPQEKRMDRSASISSGPHPQKILYRCGRLSRSRRIFRDGCNRGKADAGSAVFGGTVSVLAFPDVSVKAVGGDDIQSVSMADFRGEAEIPGLRADGTASGDGIFHEIPEQRRHVKLEKGKGLQRLNVPVGADFCLDCHLVIVAEQGVQRGVGTVIHRCVLCKAGVIFRKMRPDLAGVALFRKG